MFSFQLSIIFLNKIIQLFYRDLKWKLKIIVKIVYLKLLDTKYGVNSKRHIRIVK